MAISSWRPGAALERRLKSWRCYRHPWGFSVGFYNLLVRRLGVPLPGRGRVISVRVASLAEPIFARLGTSDLVVAEELFGDDEYAAVKRLADVRTVLDLGANCGLSIRIWQQAWPGVQVVAVEPDPGNAAVCRRNIRTCAPNKPAVLLEACAAGTARKVVLDRGREEFAFKIAAAGAQPQSAGADLDAFTIPQILAAANVPPDAPIDLLKCDIEGAEEELFAHCHDWIRRCHFLVVETHAPYTPARLQEDLARAGVRFEQLSRMDKGTTSVLHLKRSP